LFISKELISGLNLEISSLNFIFLFLLEYLDIIYFLNLRVIIYLNKKWIRDPFIGKLSYKIARLLQKIGYNVAFYSLFKIRSLCKLKDAIPIWDRSAVYKIECCMCKSAYIGQTGRSLHTYPHKGA